MSEGTGSKADTPARGRPDTTPQPVSPKGPGLVRRQPDVRIVAAPTHGAVLLGGTVAPDLQLKTLEVLQHIGGMGVDETESLIHMFRDLAHDPHAVGALGVAFVASIRPGRKPVQGQKLIRPDTPPVAYGLGLTFPGSDYSAVFYHNPIQLAASAQLEPDLQRNFLHTLERSASKDPAVVADPVGAVITEARRRRRLVRREQPDKPAERAATPDP